MMDSEQPLGILGLNSHQAHNLLIYAVCRKGIFPKSSVRIRLQVKPMSFPAGIINHLIPARNIQKS